MADKSLLPRLKRLFSTDVVIRNVGGTSLVVSDPDATQAFGTFLNNNNTIDRFTRIFKGGNSPSFAGGGLGTRFQYNPNLNYQAIRFRIYSDYESMDSDGLVSSVLDIVAADCTGKSETNEIISITSSNERVQEALHGLFYNVLNIKFTLFAWIRSMCKYGDFFLRLHLSEEFGVYNVIPMTPYDVIREEGTDPTNPFYVCFKIDPVAVAGGVGMGSKAIKFENFEIAHFRLNFDSSHLPYGRSFLEPGRKIFKQMTLMEDAMLLQRITRSADKRVFKIDVGNIPANEVPQYMELIKTTSARTPYQDPNTGDYNLKYNLQNMMEDFYIPHRGDKSSTQIETTPGLQYSGMDDVMYLRDKMLMALKVPKDRLNITEDINGKSTLAGIGVNWSKTVERIQDITLSELYKIAMIHLYLIGFDEADLNNFELELTVPSIIFLQEKVALLKEQMDLYAQIKDTRILSSDWFLANIMQMSEDQIMTERDLVAEDMKRSFRYDQLSTEGNDPEVTGESFGTPHDLATMTGLARYNKTDLPKGYDEADPVGRPPEPSIIGTDNSSFGRDPMGKKGSTLEPYVPTNLKPVYRGSAISETKIKDGKEIISSLKKAFGGRKLPIFESKVSDSTEDIQFLNEDNIKADGEA